MAVARKKRSSGIKLMIVLLVVAIILNAVLAAYAGTISVFLTGTNTADDGEVTFSDLYSEGYNIDVELEAEGSVLLKNDNGTLPFKDGAKVTLLGFYSYCYILGGDGSGKGADDDYTVSMYDAFTEAGIDVNKAAWDWLEQACGGDAANSSGTTIQELSRATYESMPAEVIGDYTDYAVVTIARNGGEGSTLTREYLQLSANEKELLAFCAENFDHTIVLINSSNAMELGFLEEAENNVAAALWIGGPGESGMVGVGRVLAGAVNPSGHTVDTWAYDLTTAPSYYNTGNNRYTNFANFGYYQYEEGIYVGYRWYETADAEGYFDSPEFAAAYGVNGYENVVQYPFGYGLSYTTFTQEIVSSDIKLDAHTTENYVEVKVTNTGAVAGKDVIQLYMNAPYNTDPNCGIQGIGLEKAHTVLVGFQKTDVLEPGESETYKVYFDTDDLCSYDYCGYGCYVLEQGDYSFNIQADAHTVLGTVSANLASTLVYNEAGVGKRDCDGVIAVNQLDDVSAGDGAYSADLSTAYLSRSNFASGIEKIRAYGPSDRTTACSDAVAAVLSTAGQQTTEYTYQYYKNGVLATATDYYYFAGSTQNSYMLTAPDGSDMNDPKWAVTYRNAGDPETTELSYTDLAGLDYDDPKWDELLDNLTLEEMVYIQWNMGWSTPAVESAGKAYNVVKDGPGEPGNAGFVGATWFCSEVVMASTWNPELIERTGRCYGEQASYFGLAGSYAPAMDTHRSPLGGRNFEYYSEDGFIAGKMGAAQVRGMQSAGIMVYIKHFVLNDLDTNRDGAITFANEQSIRELYLTPFELAVKEGGARGIMGSLNRIGASWAHYGLYTNILRGEWGFDGIVITDGVGPGGSTYSTPNAAMFGGIDAMLGGTASVSGFPTQEGEGATSTLYGIYKLREVAHRMLFQSANSQAEAHGVELNTSWYIGWVILDVLFVAGIACIVIFKTIPYYKRKKMIAEAKAAKAE